MSIFSPHLMLGYLFSANFAHAALMTVWISLASLLAGMVIGLLLAVITGPSGSASAPTSGISGSMSQPRVWEFLGVGATLFALRVMWSVWGAVISAAVRAGWTRDIQLAWRVRNVVAGRSGCGPDPAVPDPEHARIVGRCRRCGRGQYLAGETSSGTTQIRPPYLSRARSLDGRLHT